MGDRGSGATGNSKTESTQLYGSCLLDPVSPSCLWGQSSHASHPSFPGKNYADRDLAWIMIQGPFLKNSTQLKKKKEFL